MIVKVIGMTDEVYINTDYITNISITDRVVSVRVPKRAGEFPDIQQQHHYYLTIGLVGSQHHIRFADKDRATQIMGDLVRIASKSQNVRQL